MPNLALPRLTTPRHALPGHTSPRRALPDRASPGLVYRHRAMPNRTRLSPALPHLAAPMPSPAACFHAIPRLARPRPIVQCPTAPDRATPSRVCPYLAGPNRTTPRLDTPNGTRPNLAACVHAMPRRAKTCQTSTGQTTPDPTASSPARPRVYDQVNSRQFNGSRSAWMASDRTPVCAVSSRSAWQTGHNSRRLLP